MMQQVIKKKKLTKEQKEYIKKEISKIDKIVQKIGPLLEQYVLENIKHKSTCPLKKIK